MLITPQTPKPITFKGTLQYNNDIKDTLPECDAKNFQIIKDLILSSSESNTQTQLIDVELEKDGQISFKINKSDYATLTPKNNGRKINVIISDSDNYTYSFNQSVEPDIWKSISDALETIFNNQAGKWKKERKIFHLIQNLYDSIAETAQKAASTKTIFLSAPVMPEKT